MDFRVRNQRCPQKHRSQMKREGQICSWKLETDCILIAFSPCEMLLLLSPPLGWLFSCVSRFPEVQSVAGLLNSFCVQLEPPELQILRILSSIFLRMFVTYLCMHTSIESPAPESRIWTQFFAFHWTGASIWSSNAPVNVIFSVDMLRLRFSFAPL